MAAQPVNSNLDLLKNEILNFKIHNLSTAPSTTGWSGINYGFTYYNTTDLALYIWNGTAFQNPGSSVSTNLSLGTATTTTFPILNSNGTGFILPGATTSLAGLLISTDKAKLDGVTGSNTGDETATTIRTKLGITTLSGSNTGDQTTITGNAGTATTLQTARTINGISFNGSANITINAVDSTARIASSEKGAVNGVATLDGAGLVPATQLPSYVDDVLEYTNLATFPTTGETGKIYVALDTNKTYRWSGSVYVLITSGAVDSVAGRTGIVVLTKTDVGLSSVDNTSDAGKPVSTAQQAALNLKADLASPTFTGDPKAPTPATADNDTSIATTAFVKAQGYTTNTGTVTKAATTFGDGVALTYAITHGQGADCIAEVRYVSNNTAVLCEKVYTNATTVTLNFNVAPATNSLRVTIIG